MFFSLLPLSRRALKSQNIRKLKHIRHYEYVPNSKKKEKKKEEEEGRKEGNERKKERKKVRKRERKKE